MNATLTVSPDEADIRLDRWFRRHFPGSPQSMIQRLCRTGQVRVDGNRAGASTRLAAGQTVRLPPLDASPEPQARPSPEIAPEIARDLLDRVLYRDDQLIVLNKPYGLPVQGGPGIAKHLDLWLDTLRFGAERPKTRPQARPRHFRRAAAGAQPRNCRKARCFLPLPSRRENGTGPLLPAGPFPRRDASTSL